MNRKIRTEILVHSDLDFLENLATCISDRYPIQVIEPPQGGLVMIPMRDSALKQQFYLGEVYVNECKTSILGHMGLGIAMDSGPNMEVRVYALSVIDAAFSAQVKEVAQLEAAIVIEGERQRRVQLKQTALLLKTQVSFETLDEEVKA